MIIILLHLMNLKKIERRKKYNNTDSPAYLANKAKLDELKEEKRR